MGGCDFQTTAKDSNVLENLRIKIKRVLTH